MSVSIKKSTPFKSLKGEVVRAFKSNFQGELLQAGDQDYNEARKVYNAMINKRFSINPLYLLFLLLGSKEIKV